MYFLFSCNAFKYLQVWDARKKGTLHTFQDTYQVTSVTFNDTAEQIISGGIDNVIKVRIIQHVSFLLS